jgi:hypothetical protein
VRICAAWVQAVQQFAEARPAVEHRADLLDDPPGVGVERRMLDETDH